jgi:hypothetical protein
MTTLSYDEAKTLNINVSVAINNAAVLAAAATAATDGVVDPVDYFLDSLPRITDAVLELQASKMVEAALGGTPVAQPSHPAPYVGVDPSADAVAIPFAQAHPGVVVSTVPAAAYYEAQGPAPAPAQVPGATDGDPAVAALWAEFFQNQGAWYNNVHNKKNPKGPDFKHKDKKGPDGYNVGLWINDKKNPSWVKARLASIGIV